MRILRGTTVVETAQAEARGLLSGRRLVVDVGSGDGRWPYEMARKDDSSLYVGMDPDASQMADYAYRASRKPARGGVRNVLYVVASVEQLPEYLIGAAELVVVNFPWGALLRGMLEPQPQFIAALASIGRPAATYEMVLTYDPSHDHGATPAGASLPPPAEPFIWDTLAPAYEGAGLVLETAGRLSREEALAIPSTWGRRLLHGREREVFLLKGRRSP